MDTQIKDTADSMYERSFVESAVSSRADTTNLMKQKAAKRNAKTRLGGREIQSIIKSQAQHIERCMAARLESYQRAYEEVRRIPIEQEMAEIREDFESVGELQVKNSCPSLRTFCARDTFPWDTT